MQASTSIAQLIAARPSSRWLTLWVLAAGGFVVNLDMRAVVPLLPSLAEDLGVGVTTAGLVATAYMLPYGICQLFYGPLADRCGRVQVARWTLLGFAIGTSICAFVPSFEALLVTRFLTGAVAAAVFPMSLAYVGDTFEYRDRPGAISVLLTSSAASQLFSLSLGGILASLVSWRAIFLLDGILAFIAVLGLFWIRAPERQVQPENTAVGFRALLGAGRKLVIIAFGFAQGVLFFGGMTYLGAYLHERWGLSYAAVGLCLGVYGLTMILAARLLPWFARRLDEPRRFLSGAIASGLGYVGLGLMPTWEGATCTLILLGIGLTAAHTVLQARATEIVPAARSTGIAVFACALFMGGSIGTAIIGAGIDLAGYVPVLVGIGVTLWIYALLGWRALKLTQPPHEPVGASRD